MIAPDKVQMLQEFLGALPPELAARLAKAVELDRLSGGSVLPHALILDGLRPVLRQGEAVRVATPRRLFCRPFEDLFQAGPRKAKQKGVIGRDAIVPVWTWLEQTLLPDATAAFVRGTRDALLGFREEEALERAAEFWQAASGAIGTALTDKAGRARAKAVLGNEIVLGDAEDMAIVLAAAPEALQAQALLPKPVAHLSDAVLLQLREVSERVAARLPDAAPYLPVIAMRRLARPWEALRLPVAMSRQPKDTLISASDMGLVGEVLFAEMDAHLAVLRAARHPDFDAEAVVQAVAGFAVLSTGLVKEVEMRRDGRWGQRLVKARASAAEALEGLLERAGREILAALPMQRAGFTGGPRQPDLSRAPDESKRERALRYVTLLSGCHPFAGAVSVAAVLKAGEDEVDTALRTYGEDLLRELRAADGDVRLRGQDMLAFAADLVQSLRGADEAETLRRRGRAALGLAAPAAEQSAA